MSLRVLLSGASGMIGTALRMRLRDMGHDVRLLVRRPPHHALEVSWDPEAGSVPAAQIEWADAVVSLSGSPLLRVPWTPSYRRTILESRTRSAHAMATAIADSQHPPAVWVSASAVGYYGRGPALDPFDESSPKGSGFLSDVVAEWEAATAPAAEATRVVLARSGIVLGPVGALAPLVLAARCGLGTTFGTGAQRWPWVALSDEARAIEHLLTAEVSGPANIAAPVLNTQADVAEALARQLHRPNWLRVPAPLIRMPLGAIADDMLLADQPTDPRVLEDSGFDFDVLELDEAIAMALGRTWKPKEPLGASENPANP